MKFSIVTPSYNQARFLERTIQSVITQSIGDMEYLIFDGGSEDGSVSILERYDAHIDHWISEPDNGQTHAVNKGLSMATGEIIGWLNSDDVYRPHALTGVARFFDANPEALFVYGEADYIDPADTVTGQYRTTPWDFSSLIQSCFLCQPSVFFRRAAIERFGLLDESLHYCMDYEFWLRCGEQVDFHYLPQVLSASRLYPENKTLSSRPAILEEISNMLKRRLGYVPRRWLVEYAHEISCGQRGLVSGVSGRLSQSARIIREWHQLNWRFNQRRMPWYPVQLLSVLPVIPASAKKAFRKVFENATRSALHEG